MYHQSQHKLIHIGIRISSWASSEKPGGEFTEREGHIIDLRSVWHGCRRNELEQKPWYFEISGQAMRLGLTSH